jgi:hypothetical protein
VIDLSDSEDDGFEGNSSYQSLMHSPFPVSGKQPSWIATPGSVSVTGNELEPPPATVNVPPAALLEKEQEIKKMRELIAQREQNRLRKLVMR